MGPAVKRTTKDQRDELRRLGHPYWNKIGNAEVAEYELARRRRMVAKRRQALKAKRAQRAVPPIERPRSSTTVSVTRHDVACPIFAAGQCDCATETEDTTYVRVCANCGGKLKDRRSPYCSAACRQDTRVRSKNLEARQHLDDVHQSGRGDDP